MGVPSRSVTERVGGAWRFGALTVVQGLVVRDFAEVWSESTVAVLQIWVPSATPLLIRTSKVRVWLVVVPAR